MEALKDGFMLPVRDAGAGIAHAKPGFVAVVPATNHNACARRRVLMRIVEQIHDHLHETALVALDKQRLTEIDFDQLRFPLKQRMNLGQRFNGDTAQIKWRAVDLQDADLQLLSGQQIVDAQGQSLNTALGVC